jgi:energy-coupling factor transport system permease protein
MRASSLFLDRQSPLHRWHPLTNLLIALLGLVIASMLTSLEWVAAYFVLVQISLSVSGQIFAPFIKSIFFVIWPFILSLAIIQGFFSPGEEILFTLSSFTFTQEGLFAGLSFALRILVALSAMILLIMTVRPDRLMQALREIGLPKSIAYIVLTALQIFPRFQDRANVILDAQQARGLEMQVNWICRIPLLVPMISPLLLSSIVDVEERAMALESRAFNYPGQRSQLSQLLDSQSQKLFRALLLLAVAALLLSRIASIFQR